MSKAAQEKIVVDVKDEPILDELGVPDLIRDFHGFHVKEKASTAEAEKFAAKKKNIGLSLRAAIEAVKADTITYSGQKDWKATLIKSETPASLNETKLVENLLKLGKLNIKEVTAIIEKSKDPAKPKAAYVLVTVQE